MYIIRLHTGVCEETSLTMKSLLWQHVEVAFSQVKSLQLLVGRFPSSGLEGDSWLMLVDGDLTLSSDGDLTLSSFALKQVNQEKRFLILVLIMLCPVCKAKQSHS